MNKYLEFEIDFNEVNYLIKHTNLTFEFIILDSLKKLKSACIKNRVKDTLFGINIGPNENLDKLLGADMIARAKFFKRLGFDFVNINIARFMAIEYFNNNISSNKDTRRLSKSHFDVYKEFFNQNKGRLDFTVHMPTDDFIYRDPNDMLFNDCIRLSNEVAKDLPQKVMPLTFHAYRAPKSSDLSRDLEVSRNRTVDLIIRTAQYLSRLEEKQKLKVTLSLEMLNQELPTSHYIRYCVSPHQVLETYHQAMEEDEEGLVKKYYEEGVFSVTFDIGHFLLDQKFKNYLAGRPKYRLNHALYYGFEEFSKRISLYHISGILEKKYLHQYLDKRRSEEFMTKFDKEYTHHCPFLISDAGKVGEVLKQVEIFSSMEDNIFSNL
jgi:hypothetical protein